MRRGTLNRRGVCPPGTKTMVTQPLKTASELVWVGGKKICGKQGMVAKKRAA